MKKDTSWGGVANWYDQLLADKDSYQGKVILPNLMRIVEPKAGMAILDLACGQGFFSYSFAAAGARVLGVDLAPELIKLAKSHATQASAPTFFAATADAIPTIAPASMDVVVIVLAIQNIENVQGVFDECARVLKLGGRVVLVLNHPVFRVPKRSSWEWDDAKQMQYRRIDAYLSESKEEIAMHPGKSEEVKTISFHRPLQYFFKKLNKAGFVVTRFEEWNSHRQSQTGPRGKEEDRMRKEIPLFLCMEGRKG